MLIFTFIYMISFIYLISFDLVRPMPIGFSNRLYILQLFGGFLFCFLHYNGKMLGLKPNYKVLKKMCRVESLEQNDKIVQ